MMRVSSKHLSFALSALLLCVCLFFSSFGVPRAITAFSEVNLNLARRQMETLDGLALRATQNLPSVFLSVLFVALFAIVWSTQRCDGSRRTKLLCKRCMLLLQSTFIICCLILFYCLFCRLDTAHRGDRGSGGGRATHEK